MTSLASFLTIIGGFVAIATVAGAVWAVVRTSAQDTTITRLRSENEDYVRRLNYLEPRVEVLERENETLHKLHNPSDAIATLMEQEADNHRETLNVLKLIDRHLGGASA